MFFVIHRLVGWAV